MLTTVGAAVVMTVEPEMAEDDPEGVMLAVTVASPALFPVASAASDTVNVLESDVLHVTLLVMFCVDPSL